MKWIDSVIDYSSEVVLVSESKNWGDAKTLPAQDFKAIQILYVHFWPSSKTHTKYSYSQEKKIRNHFCDKN